MARFLASLLALLLVLPPATARAQDPATPPPPPPAESTPPPAESTEPPPPAEPTTTPPPVDTGSGDEYDTLRRTLPNDYDINYTFSGGDRKRKRDNDPGHAAKRAARMGIAGGTLALVGVFGVIGTLAGGLVVADKAKDDLEKLKNQEAGIDDPMAIDYDKRRDLLKRGEAGDRTAIIGGAISGGALAIGLGLLLGARSVTKRTYGPTDTGTTPTSAGGRQPMSAKTRTNLAIYGTLLGLYGLIGVAAGAVLIKNDDTKKKRNGTILLVTGSIFAAVAIPMFIALAIDKSRRNTARLSFGPAFVRKGGGAQLSLRF
ncbi:MAG TPA: hypothetical protein VFG69_13090 [Nannocystaceae bacterium]|nr:hypothetical protein [Nannocystaceae bacterium]